MCFDAIIDNIVVTSFCGFLLRVCDIELSGVFMTFLYSFMNFGNLWCTSLNLFLVDDKKGPGI